MSLNIRYLSNGEKEVFRVLHTDTGEKEIYSKREEIPDSIRHYVPEKVQIVEPDTARIFGVLDVLYPNHPKCGMPEYDGKICIAESCIHGGENGQYKDCPYYKEISNA